MNLISYLGLRNFPPTPLWGDASINSYLLRGNSYKADLFNSRKKNKSRGKGEGRCWEGARKGRRSSAGGIHSVQGLSFVGALLFPVSFGFVETGPCPVRWPGTLNPLLTLPSSGIRVMITVPICTLMSVCLIWLRWWGKEEKMGSISALGCCDHPVTSSIWDQYWLLIY